MVVLALIVSPPMVVAAVLIAAGLHEAGHLAALRHYGVPVRAIRLTAFGAEIDAPRLARLSYGRELAVVLAGPAVNLLCGGLLALAGLWFSWECAFLFSGAHLALAAFNLLPVLPLDGGRALYLLAAYFFAPAAGERFCAALSLGCALALCALGAEIALLRGGGWLFLLAACGLLWGAMRQLGLARGGKNV